jgi:hypothetical protein
MPALAAFVTPCTAKPISFRVQQCVEGLFDRSTDHVAEMIPDPGFINLDEWPIAFNPSSSLIASIPSSVWRKPAILKVRKILYVIRRSKHGYEVRITHLLLMIFDAFLYVNFSLRLLMPCVMATHRLCMAVTTMSDLQPTVKQHVELRDPSNKPGLSPARIGRKVAICILAVVIASAMITWFGFLGWGVVATMRWLWECIKSL